MREQQEPTNDLQRPVPFEHAFVATDFSDGGGRALARTARLPLARRGNLTIVHVLSERIPQKVRADEEKLARRQLDQASKSVRKLLTTLGRRDVKVSSVLCRGQAYVEIIRHARAAGADLVIVGRHGRRPLRDMFIGSTAERVIRLCNLPVLVVNAKAGRSYRRPVVSVDLQDTCRSVVNTALRILDPEVMSATMVHAYHVPFEGVMLRSFTPQELTELRKEYRQTAAAEVAKLQAELGETGIRWKTRLVRGDPRAALGGEAFQLKADLIALGTHGRSGLAHALLGSVAERVIQAAVCDVLVARPARISFKLP